MIVRIGNHSPLSLVVPCQLSKGQVETPEANFASGMRQLNGVYTQLYNRRHRTVGHLLQGRYKAVLIQKESHLVEVCGPCEGAEEMAQIPRAQRYLGRPRL